tara:strand:- start:1615 stop:2046 length:432 start_codon:yes stop_codon:yes gene_type:complete
MSEYYEPNEDTLSVFNATISKSSLPSTLKIAIRSNNREKDLYRIDKTSQLMRSETKKEIYIVVNELIFEQLEEQHQSIVAEEAIASIVYDLEKDKITLKRGDVGITKRGAFTGILKKYGAETYEVVQESVKTLYNAKKEEAEV